MMTLMDVPKGQTKDFMEAILSSVNSEPKSVLEIANSAKKSWESTKRALELLESFEVVQSKKEGDRKLFFRKELAIMGEKDNKTWFNVPLEKRDADLINFVFDNTEVAWKEKTGTDVGRTQMQKVLVRVNNVCNLKLPIGRYLYGMICVKPYDPSEIYAYPMPENGRQIIDATKKAVEDYHRFSVKELEIAHYKETGNSLYLAKVDSISLLTSSQFNKDIFSQFCALLSKILVNLPHDETDLIVLFTEFIGAVNNIAQLDEGELRQARDAVLDSFNEMWELIATTLFYKDLSKKYSEHELAKIRLEIENHKLIVIYEEISKLNEYTSKREHQKCPEYEELKKLQGSVKITKLLEEKELHKLAEESAKNPSKIFGEFGLD